MAAILLCMSQHTFKYQLGCVLTDVLTGFTGRVIYRVEHITGCDNYGLLPEGLDKNGEPKESKQFDENRLELVKGKKIVDLKPKKEEPAPPGGPQPNASRKNVRIQS